MTASASTISLELARISNIKLSRREAAYPTVFTAHSLFFISLIVLAYSQLTALYFLAGECLIYLLYLLIFPPYSSPLHFVGVIFNQLTLTVWVGLIMALRWSAFSEDSKYDFVRIIIALLIIIDFIAIIRIAWQLYCFGSQLSRFKSK